MALKNSLLELEKGIATLFINRPEKLNALNKETIQELHDTLKLIDENPEIQVIVITGSGEKAFVAGADIAEFFFDDSLENIKNIFVINNQLPPNDLFFQKILKRFHALISIKQFL